MLLKPVVRLCVVAVAIRLLVLVLLPEGAFSYDLRAFLRVADFLRAGKNPYAETPFLNYPPLWMQILYGLDGIARLTTFPLHLVIRVSLILLDVVNLALAWWMARRFLNIARPGPLLLWGLVLNPVLILLVCQHGNFDVLVATMVLSFTAAMLKFGESKDPVDWLIGSLSVGLGVLAKTAPFALAPVLMHGFRELSVRARLLGALLLIGPATLGLSVIYVLSPAPVMRHVIRYSSLEGWFGWTGILNLLGLGALSTVYARVFPVLILVIATWISLRMLRSGPVEPRRLVLAVALILGAIIVFGPGYGPQYIAWCLPLFVLTSTSFERRWRSVLVGTYVVAILTYLVEYAVLPSHGAFLIRGLRQTSLYYNTAFLHGKAAQTLLRLPMFAGYLLIFVDGVSLLGRRETEAT